MKIPDLRILRVWLIFLFWSSIIFTTQVFSIFIGDLLDLLAGFPSQSSATLFFRVLWGFSAIMAISLSLFLSHERLRGAHWNFPKIAMNQLRAGKLVLLGILIRLALAPFFSHAGDMTTFLLAGYNIAHGRYPYEMELSAYGGPRIPNMIQGRDIFALGYPPLWGLLTSFSYRISNFIAPDSLFLYVFAVKLWPILADILLAYLIFEMIKTTLNQEKALKAALYFLFCPFIILIGSIWGQNDSLCALLTVLAIYLLVREHAFASGLALGAGFAVKYYPILIAPILFLSSRGRRDKGAFLGGLAAAASFVLFYPFLMWGSEGGIKYFDMVSTLSQLSGDTQTLLTPFFAFETMIKVTRKDSWIQTWFWAKENPFMSGVWMLPMIWLYLRHEELVSAKSNDTRPTLEEVLSSSICALLFFATFKFWVTEQIFVTPLALCILYSYTSKTDDLDYLNMTWVLLVLSCWMTTRLGSYLLLPIWDIVRSWAFYITYLGNRYMFWMQSLTSSFVGLFLATFNMTYVYVLQKRITDSMKAK